MKGGMKLVKRTKPKIIRSVRFHISIDPENHYREQLMLYSPWRNENTDLLRGCETYQERFNQLNELVLCNRQNYEYHSEILDKAMEDLDNDHLENMIYDSVAPNAQHINEQDGATKQKPSELFGCFDPGNNKQHSQYDVHDDIGIFPRCDDQEELLVKRISNDEYRKLVTRQFRINRKSQIQILRRQFPLRPASAKTIHRCQGDTQNAAVVDFPHSTQERMHYVGSRRVRNSSSLHIINLNEHKIRVNEKVVNEMNRLRTEANLVPLVALKTENDSITIVFQNVRSLHLHIDDVRSDYNIQKADVNIFVETRLCTLDKDDVYNINGFTLYRNDYNQSPTRSCYGSAFYVKTNFDCTEIPHRFNFNGVEITIMVIDHLIPNLHVIGIYRSSSNVSLAKFIDALNYLHDSKL